MPERAETLVTQAADQGRRTPTRAGRFAADGRPRLARPRADAQPDALDAARSRPGISTGHQFLFGGCGLGAAIAALEGSSGRPVVWATAQYLSYANPPSIMDIDVTIAVAGKQVTQARAVGHVGDREILTVNAALGSRDARGRRASGPRCPDVPGARRVPEAHVRASRAPTRSWSASTSASPTPATSTTLPGPPSAGRSLRAVGAHPRRARDVGGHAGHPRRLRARSASARPSGRRPAATASTTRCAWPASCPPSGCCSTSASHAVVNGFGHGVVHLWAEDGTLLATASQSTIVRFWDGGRRGARDRVAKN